MSETQDQIREIEISIEEAQKIVAFGEAIKRLGANKDFQTVILEGYYRDEASRLTLLLAHPDTTDKMRESIHRSIAAIGELYGYFQARLGQADMMAKGIEEAQDLITELENEEDQA